MKTKVLMTFYDDYNPKTYKEVIDNTLILYKEYTNEGKTALEIVLNDDSTYTQYFFTCENLNKRVYKVLHRLIPFKDIDAFIN